MQPPVPDFPFRSYGEYDWVENPYDEHYEEPLAQDDNWYEELAVANRYDTLPDTGLVSPPTMAIEEAVSFGMVVRMAAEVLDLQLPSIEVKANVLTEVLQTGISHTEPLLPFNEDLTDILLGAWAKPCTSIPLHRAISCRHCPAPCDPVFLTQHPTPESLVIQASTSCVNLGAFPSTPPNKECKRLDTFGKRIFSSTSFLLRSLNIAWLLGRYTHSTWDLVAQVLPMVLEAPPILNQAMAEGRNAAKLTVSCGLDMKDSMGRAIASSVALRDHALLRSTGFSGDVKASLMDMPFDCTRLFGDKVDSVLKSFRESTVTAWSMGLSTAHANPTLLVAPSVATVGVTSCVISNRATMARRVPSLFVALDVIPTDLVRIKARSPTSLPPP